MKTRIGNRVYGNHTYIMGILNVTPDSFSDGGRYTGLDAALYHAEQMLREGADILDVGGESTRPGYTRISDEEEISRIIWTDIRRAWRIVAFENDKNLIWMAHKRLQ